MGNEMMSAVSAEMKIELNEMWRVAQNFIKEMEAGLDRKNSSLKMLPAFVGSSCGLEKGSYLAVDFGGTNLRVMLVDLCGNKKFEIKQMKSFRIGQDVISGTRDNLCQFVLDSLNDFCEESLVGDEQIRIGFTFSFPMQQTGINVGKLVQWTKGYTTSGLVGEDIVEVLHGFFKKNKGERFEIRALANDAVSTLVAGSYLREDCSLGVILGTGTNIACMDDLGGGRIAINLECGNFSGFNMTKYDWEVELVSSNRGEQFAEKMIAAKYLGELASRIVNSFSEAKEFSVRFKPLSADDYFSTEEISQMAEDITSDWKSVKSIFGKRRTVHLSDSDCLIFQKISQLVLKRSAYLVVTEIVAAIMKNDPKLEAKHGVAIDGSLYEKAWQYRQHLEDAIGLMMVGKTGRIEHFLAKDASGFGAAIVAAIAAEK